MIYYISSSRLFLFLNMYFCSLSRVNYISIIISVRTFCIIKDIKMIYNFNETVFKFSKKTFHLNNNIFNQSLFFCIWSLQRCNNHFHLSG